MTTISVESLFQTPAGLIALDDYAGPVADPQYIEGTIELVIDGKPILSREQVDLVDQLWAYLIQGLEDVSAGDAFSTFYPDMPVEIRLTPAGDAIAIEVDKRGKIASATVPRAALLAALVPAATRFFERLRTLVPSKQASHDRYLARLAKLG